MRILVTGGAGPCLSAYALPSCDAGNGMVFCAELLYNGFQGGLNTASFHRPVNRH